MRRSGAANRLIEDSLRDRDQFRAPALADPPEPLECLLRGGAGTTAGPSRSPGRSLDEYSRLLELRRQRTCLGQHMYVVDLNGRGCCEQLADVRRASALRSTRTSVEVPCAAPAPQVRRSPRSTTTTTYRPEYSPHRSPSELPAIPPSAFQTHAGQDDTGPTPAAIHRRLQRTSAYAHGRLRTSANL